MGRAPAVVVRRTLREYLDRGIFSGFHEQRGRNGTVAFSFFWLTDRPFRLVCDGRRATLQLRDLLPHVPARSALDRDLRDLLHTRVDGDLPRHRMVDSKRAVVSLRNRQGSLSLVLTVKNNQYTYGVRKLLNLTNEIFVRLYDSHQEYMWEQFNAPQE
jgi:hypothetical protein